MIDFVIGAFLGGAVGVTTMCLCAAAGKADKHLGTQDIDDLDRQAEKRY